jgi:cupin 2 domain-containing protein
MTSPPTIRRGNLLSGDSPSVGNEHFDTLLSTPGLSISRIASNEHTSPEGFWYNQSEDEWVMVMRGEATIEFSDAARHPLASGDWLMIPAGCRHRIASTSPDTVWLAVHFQARA